MHHFSAQSKRARQRLVKEDLAWQQVFNCSRESWIGNGSKFVKDKNLFSKIVEHLWWKWYREAWTQLLVRTKMIIEMMDLIELNLIFWGQLKSSLFAKHSFQQSFSCDDTFLTKFHHCMKIMLQGCSNCIYVYTSTNAMHKWNSLYKSAVNLTGWIVIDGYWILILYLN